MKYNIYTLFQNKITFMLIILFIIINKSNSSLSFIYPTSFYLSNGNIFIIHKYGINICNSNLNEIIKNITVFENEITEENLAKIIYSYEYRFIINIINDKIYIFDNEGNLLYNNQTKIISINENPSYYTLVPIKYENDFYYYIVGFNYNNLLHFLYYKFNNVTKENSLIFSLKNFNKQTFINREYNIQSKALTCQYMKNETYEEELTCFFLISKNETYYEIAIIFFNVNDDKIVEKSQYYTFQLDNTKYIKYMKSIINNDHSKTFICCVRENGETSCFVSLFKFLKANVKNVGYKCLTNYNGMKINYFEETQNYILNCIGKDEKSILIDFLNADKILTTCRNFDTLHEYSLLFSKEINDYYIISDIIINNKNNPFIQLFIEPNDGNDENPDINPQENDYSDLYTVNTKSNNIQDNQSFEYFKNKFINNPNIKNYIYQEIINNFKNDLKNGKLDYLLFSRENNTNIINDYILKDNDIILQVTSIFNQNNKENENISTINIKKECENILKEKYNIGKNENLLIFKYEYSIQGLNIPLIGYEILHPLTKEQLNLTLCKNIDIKLNIPFSINENNLYKHNPNSEYYKDICKTFKSEKGLDTTISTRKKDFNNYNMSLCPNNCEYINYDNKIKKVSCNCEVQTSSSSINSLDDIINKDKLLNNFKDIKSISNIGIIKCYKIVFSKDGLKSNIGSYILLIIILIFILDCILFYKIESKIFFNKINAIKSLNNNQINKDNDLKNKYLYKNNEIKKVYKKVKKKIPRKSNRNHNDFIIKSSLSNAELNINNLDKNTNQIINKNIENKKNYNKNTQVESLDKIPNNYTEHEINSFSYKEALENDKRSFCQYYISLLMSKHLILFSFYPKKDYNSMVIKICLFFCSFALYYFINSLFFTDVTMEKIYQDEGIFNFIYSIPQIIYSAIISSLINSFIRFLSLTENIIIKIKKDTQNLEKIKKSINIKFIIFYIICFALLAFFWYFLSSFGAIYKYTQIYLLKDTLISFSISLIYPFITCLIPCIIRISILKKPECYYKISKLIQSL